MAHQSLFGVIVTLSLHMGKWGGLPPVGRGKRRVELLMRTSMSCAEKLGINWTRPLQTKEVLQGGFKRWCRQNDGEVEREKKAGRQRYLRMRHIDWTAIRLA